MKSLKIHCFQHVDYEDLGCIADWCNSKRHHITFTRFYKGDTLPSAENYDWLIILGGPMGVYEDEKYSWLADEKKAILAAIENKKTVIGICLGSQLIAEVLGAKVYKNLYNEIGWFDIMLTEEGKKDSLLKGFPMNTKVLHWHGDTFDLPIHAKHISYSEACKNQAFLNNDHVLGLQFHLEVTENSIKAMLHHGKHELKNEKYIQSEKKIISFIKYIEANNNSMFRILDHLAKYNHLQ